MVIAGRLGLVPAYFSRGRNFEIPLLHVIANGVLKEISHWELYKSCTDCLCPTHWHHYEVPETTVEAGESVVDCGAAEGIFALSVAGRAGKIAVVEPWVGFGESLGMTFGDRAVLCNQAFGGTCHTAYLSGSILYGIVNESSGVP